MRPPRHQKSADLDVLSGSSSDSSSVTEEEGSSTQRFSLRHIPAFVGSTLSGDDEEEWAGEVYVKHVRSKNSQRPAKPLLKPPTPQDGSTSNPSPESTDTARISSSSFGTVVAVGGGGGGDGRDSRAASQDQAATPLQNWVDNSGWEPVSGPHEMKRVDSLLLLDTQSGLQRTAQRCSCVRVRSPRRSVVDLVLVFHRVIQF